MVIGRAVNTWPPEEETKLLSSEAKRAHLIDGAIKQAHVLPCPVRWVVDCAGPHQKYNTNRSAFWRIAKKTHSLVSSSHPAWPSELCWTNLCKIAPSEGRNPGGKLLRIQWDYCIELFKAELRKFRPKLALVLTGANWFEDFASALALDLRPARRAELVQQWGDCEGTKWVVGRHPERKSDVFYMLEIARVLESAAGL